MTKTSTVSAMTFMFNQQGVSEGITQFFNILLVQMAGIFTGLGYLPNSFSKKELASAIFACIIRQFNLTISSDCKDR